MDDGLHDLAAALSKGRELTEEEIGCAAGWLLDEGISDEPKADFLRSLQERGETPAEIAGFVCSFLAHAVSPVLSREDLSGRPLIDLCGTGGDKLGLFNVSTAASFVVAACGGAVIKHGNRGITSKCGGADVLEALGIDIAMSPGSIGRCLEQAGVAFLFAPVYHPAFRAVVGVRKRLAEEGRRTVFNLLGPLLNPSRPDVQLLGVFSPELLAPFAEILGMLGRSGAWVVYGEVGDGRGMDEMSVIGASRIARLSGDGTVTEGLIYPGEFGLGRGVELKDLEGGSARDNAEELEDILRGSGGRGRREMVVLNAGAALTAAGIAPDLATGVELAHGALDDGSAHDRLNALRSLSEQSLKGRSLG